VGLRGHATTRRARAVRARNPARFGGSNGGSGIALMRDVLRLMLVEDDADLRANLRDLLEGAGYEVISCADGREAIEHLRATTEAFSLILLDWLLPGVSGADVAAYIDGDPHHARTRVVVLTGHDRVLAAGGVAAVVAKPVRARTLVEVIDRLAGMPPRQPGDVVRRTLDSSHSGRAYAPTIAIRPPQR
jgi:two-component system sensor histidine kinase/response regulator